MSEKESKKSKKMGRPPVENPATERLPMVRVTPEKLQSYREKAKQEGKSFSEWVRCALDKALKRK